MEFKNDAVLLEELPVIQDADFHKLVPQQRWLSLLNATIFFAILAIGLFAAYFWGNIELPLWADWTIWGTLLFLWLLRVLFVWKGFERKAYLLREHDMVYRSGWLTHRLITIPFNRIQHSEIRQSFLGRLMKIARLKIYTAGGDQSDLSVPGLDPEKASEIRNFIIRRVSEHE